MCLCDCFFEFERNSHELVYLLKKQVNVASWHASMFRKLVVKFNRGTLVGISTLQGVHCLCCSTFKHVIRALCFCAKLTVVDRKELLFVRQLLCYFICRRVRYILLLELMLLDA